MWHWTWNVYVYFFSLHATCAEYKPYYELDVLTMLFMVLCNVMTIKHMLISLEQSKKILLRFTQSLMMLWWNRWVAMQPDGSLAEVLLCDEFVKKKKKKVCAGSLSSSSVANPLLPFLKCMQKLSSGKGRDSQGMLDCLPSVWPSVLGYRVTSIFLLLFFTLQGSKLG